MLQVTFTFIPTLKEDGCSRHLPSDKVFLQPKRGGGGNDGERKLEAVGTKEREQRERESLMGFWEGSWKRQSEK